MKRKTEPHHATELIIFDLGRVLVDFDFKKVMRQLQRQTHLTEAQIRHYFKTTPMWDAFERGKITPPKFFKQLEKDLHLKNLSFKAFTPLWNDIFSEMHDSVEILKKLRGRYRLAMISNVNQMHWEHVRERHPFMKWFDHPVASYAVGHRKPELEIYKLTLKRAKIPAERAIFIDDLAPHIKAAQSLGIRGHHFTGAKKLRDDLKGIL